MACDTLRRAATHAVTAAAVHWDLPHQSRRQLESALMNAMYMYARSWAPHRRTFQKVHYVTPAVLASRDPLYARQIAINLCRRVRHLVTDLERAIASDPDPRARRRRAKPAPPPPVPETIG